MRTMIDPLRRATQVRPARWCDAAEARAETYGGTSDRCLRLVVAHCAGWACRTEVAAAVMRRELHPRPRAGQPSPEPKMAVVPAWTSADRAQTITTSADRAHYRASAAAPSSMLAFCRTAR